MVEIIDYGLNCCIEGKNVKTTFQEELIYFICQNILGRGKEKGRIEQKR
jgi:hypothetical protein